MGCLTGNDWLDFDDDDDDDADRDPESRSGNFLTAFLPLRRSCADSNVVKTFFRT